MNESPIQPTHGLDQQMWIYVDESGCLGMKLSQGSSPFFCVSAVLFRDKNIVDSCYSRIETLKAELRARKEFHFTKACDAVRLSFLQAMQSFDFQHFGLIIDKSRINGFNRPFLHKAVLQTFSLHAESILNAKVVIDRTGSNDFRKMMARTLKQDMNRQYDRQVILDVKSVDSHSHNLLQLADMIAGAVARSIHPTRGSNDFRDILRNKELKITTLP